MAGKFTVMTVFGTRPEAVKMAPLVKAVERHPDLRGLVCVTGQHRHMLDSVLDAFGIKPNFDLDIMTPRQTLAGIAAKTLSGLDEVLEREKPDLVLVHGDTSAALMSALTAFYHQIPVGHVEAGLRTWARYSPFPEEMNRQMIARVSSINFCPTAANRENLVRENAGGAAYVTGNTVIDALGLTVRGGHEFSDPALGALDFEKYRVLLVTAHRRENYGRPLENICRALLDITERHPDALVLYPVHMSPAVRETVYPILEGRERVILCDPVDVFDMHNIMARCHLVLTDSGGLQEEAPALGKPVLVMRRETERPEAVAAGTVLLAGIEREDIAFEASRLLGDPAHYAAMAKAVNPYGDGRASERIVQAVLHFAGLASSPPEEFKGSRA